MSDKANLKKAGRAVSIVFGTVGQLPMRLARVFRWVIFTAERIICIAPAFKYPKKLLVRRPTLTAGISFAETKTFQ